MQTFNVKFNMAVLQPYWSLDKMRKFGKNNEGFTVVAADIEAAKAIVRSEHNINPFYVTVTAV